MNYFIGEFLGSKIMIVVKTVIIFHLSEILRDPLWGPQDAYFQKPCVASWFQKRLVANFSSFARHEQIYI